ncbi:MAG: DUF748 domain-containing protein [Chitinophagaceae bacterium]|nr:DUF748 domain-containing protein [Chitinophagaceae bacterium]
MRRKDKNAEKNKPHRRRLGLKILIGILILLIIVRLILPYVILHYGNKTLANDVKGYYGHMEDVDLSIYRGAYTICDVYLSKVDSATGKQSPFADAKEIDLSIEWKALLHGSIVGELVVETPTLNFIKEKVSAKQLAEDTTDFRILLKKFMPIKINRFEINNGSIHYIDEGSSPKVDVALTDAHIVATNLQNSYDSAEVLPSGVTADAHVYEGTFNLGMKLNPLADQATFDLNARLENTNLVLLNDFFKAYAKIDVNKGRFGLYTEVAAKNGKFTGYVKPIIKDLDVLGAEDKNDSFLRKLWEGLVGLAGQILENPKKDQVATKIPIEGEMSDPNIHVFTAIVEVLRNAFVQALFPAIDQQISIGSVGNTPQEEKSLLKKMFEKDKVEDDKSQTEKEKHEKKEKDKKKDKS